MLHVVQPACVAAQTSRPPCSSDRWLAAMSCYSCPYREVLGVVLQHFHSSQTNRGHLPHFGSEGLKCLYWDPNILRRINPNQSVKDSIQRDFFGLCGPQKCFLNAPPLASPSTLPTFCCGPTEGTVGPGSGQKCDADSPNVKKDLVSWMSALQYAFFSGNIWKPVFNKRLPGWQRPGPCCTGSDVTHLTSLSVPPPAPAQKCSVLMVHYKQSTTFIISVFWNKENSFTGYWALNSLLFPLYYSYWCANIVSIYWVSSHHLPSVLPITVWHSWSQDFSF